MVATDSTSNLAEVLAALQLKTPFDRLDADSLSALAADSRILRVGGNTAVVREGEHGDSLYIIVSGQFRVTAKAPNDESVLLAVLGPGEIFGEAAALTDRPRSATVTSENQASLVELDADALDALIDAQPSFGEAVQQLREGRSVRAAFRRVPLLAMIAELPAGDDLLEVIEAESRLVRYDPDAAIVSEGEAGDTLLVLVAGFVQVTKRLDGEDRIVGYHGPGSFFGETALIEAGRRTASVKAHTRVEALEVPGDVITRMSDAQPEIESALKDTAARWSAANQAIQREPAKSEAMAALLSTGALAAERLLVIDQSLCIHCDRCVRACAGRHGEHRLRRTGTVAASFTLPVACRLCPDPVCLLCPYEGIRRAPSGEVYITDKCVGCTACVHRCPYDVISMRSSEPSPAPRGILWALMEGGDALVRRLRGTAEEGAEDRAVKCDSCRGWTDEACVADCPVEAIFWADPQGLFGTVPGAAILDGPEQ